MNGKRKAPYYEGDTVTLSFKVKDSKGPVRDISAHVEVYYLDGNQLVIPRTRTRVDDNLVTFVVPSTATLRDGDYKAIFTVNIPPDLVRTHVIRFQVLPKGPVLGAEKDKEVMPHLTEDSSDYETTQAISEAIRMLRRGDYTVTIAVKKSKQLAQKKTNRRL